MGPDRRSTLQQTLSAMVERAERAGRRSFCERCRTFVSQKRCRFRHKGRYWSLEEVKRIRDKLADDRSLAPHELVFLELLERP